MDRIRGHYFAFDSHHFRLFLAYLELGELQLEIKALFFPELLQKGMQEGSLVGKGQQGRAEGSLGVQEIGVFFEDEVNPFE